MAKKCIGNLNKECSGKCPDYHECLERTMNASIVSELRG